MSSTQPSRGHLAALTAAFLGWLFDGFEMGLFPLIGKPALKDLLMDQYPAAGLDLALANWFNVIIATFLVGAATGGVLFGWLGDRVGRVRAMAIAIFTYAIFTGLCGLATQAWQIAGLRFIASLGMGGEWALGVALVNELWTKGSRVWMAGAIGAAANIGYLLVAFVSLGLNKYLPGIQEWSVHSIGLSQQTANYWLEHSAWRLLMVIGALPALLIFFIQIFVPESHKWEEEKASGATSHWSNTDLLGVLLGGLVSLIIIYIWSPLTPVGKGVAGVLTVVGLFAVIWGFVFPVRRYLARSGAAGGMNEAARAQVMRHLALGGLIAGVALLGTWGAAQQAPKWSTEIPANGCLFPKEYTQIWTSLGAIIMTLITPLIGDLLGRRLSYTLACVVAMASALLFYQTNGAGIGTWFFVTAFLMGGMTASFYGFFPLYLPELFPTSVRATGQGFCFNVGRVIAAVGGLQIANLVASFGTAANAYSVLCCIYLVGMVVVWFAPETKGQALK
ncbi:MAG: MFS transporter [Verrucomicrobiaceae bacterium]|nr:MFS transporter [Verrucomicrobiaceae bacterium]